MTAGQQTIASSTVWAAPDRSVEPDQTRMVGQSFERDIDRADTVCPDRSRRKIRPAIPARSNRRMKIEHNRSIATRYDQLASSFPGMVRRATARCGRKFVLADLVAVALDAALAQLAALTTPQPYRGPRCGEQQYATDEDVGQHFTGKFDHRGHVAIRGFFVTLESPDLTRCNRFRATYWSRLSICSCDSKEISLSSPTAWP